MFRKKWFWIVLVVVVAAGAALAAFARRGENGTMVTVETIQKRDLEAIVSASGKIEPKKTVNISAQTMGRVTRLGVQEGDRVRQGQFLLQIDPVNAEAAVRRDVAAVAGAMTALEQSKVSLQSGRAQLENARQNLKRQQELWAAGLTTRETLERTQAEVEIRESDLKAREQEIKTRETQLNQQQAGLASSQHTLAQVRFDAPFDGIVTRRNVEEGENVVVGTMNNAGTVLLTIADMSIIEAEIEVDETDIPEVKLAQQARVTIDAIPDQMFSGRVTEIGNSPIQNAATSGIPNTAQATNFKVVVTLQQEIPDIRPGFTCTAEITTATRKNVLSVPIQALTVRELLYDPEGTLVRDPPPPRPSRFRVFRQSEPQPAAPLPEPPGHTRRETEGVFVLRANRAVFLPIKVGIAGERYFEVVSGLDENEQVITGPFTSVRELADGSEVRLQETPGRS